MIQFVLTGLDGKPLGSVQGPVWPGQGMFHDFDLRVSLGQREQVHGEVWIPPHEGGVMPVSVALEIYDVKSGATVVSVTPCIRVFPQPIGQ
jgi:hypothetical protein